MKNCRMLVACAVVLFAAFFITQEVWAGNETRTLRVQLSEIQAEKAPESPIKEKEEAEKTEAEKEFPVSGSVEVIGSRDTGVWLYAERKVAKDWALFISASKYQKGFEEITFGPAYYITPEIQVGVSFGSAWYNSSDRSRLVISAFGYMETDNLKAEVLFEKYGRDPKPYYRVYAETPITPISEKLAVGVHGERFIGWGPRISWSFNKNVNLWLSPLIERQGDNVLVGGIQFTF